MICRKCGFTDEPMSLFLSDEPEDSEWEGNPNLYIKMECTNYGQQYNGVYEIVKLYAETPEGFTKEISTDFLEGQKELNQG